MAFFDSWLTGDTFNTWYTKFNSNATLINAQRELITNYVLDGVTPPTETTIVGRPCLAFAHGADEIISFNFPAPSFKSVNEDRHLRLTYSMSSAFAGDVALVADFNVFENGAVMSIAAPTETDTVAITVNPGATIQDYDESLTLSAANLTSTTDWVRVNLKRFGTDGADTHTGIFYLYHIEVV